MKILPLNPLLLLCAGVMMLTGIPQEATGQEFQRPVRDNVGFCWDANEMDRLIGYLHTLERPETEHADSPPLIGGISPHDDYLYAARVYYPLYPRLHAREVVIFGVTHGTVRKEIGDPRGLLLLDDFKTWTAPYGPVEVSPLRDLIAARLDSSLVRVSRKAHELEHSIEATVPFLQHYNKGVRITPIMVTAMPLEEMKKTADALAAVIASYVRQQGLVPGEDIVFLISSDANHYGMDFSNVPFGEDQKAHKQGTDLDQMVVKECLAGILDDAKVAGFTRYAWGQAFTEPGKTLWCGKFSIPMGLLTIQRTMRLLGKPTVRGVPLRYSDTFTEGVLPLHGTSMGTTAPFSLKHWVGFVSVGITAE